jgi:dipeptidyl aminopeptidase/acylaminoacyl peptidase
MLIDERRDYGSDHWAIQYWTKFIGDLKSERAKLEALSPVNHAAAFRAPVLLIHGKDDLVVPMRHSARMERALNSENKSVELIQLAGEDHWLSTGETRLETLKALDAFVSAHIGAQ